MASGLKWLFGVASALLALLMLFLLATGALPGMRWGPEKSVTVSTTPRPEFGGVTLYVFPPLSSLEIEGQGTLLAVQFTNHLSVPVKVGEVVNMDLSCFAFAAQGTTVTQLGPYETQSAAYIVKPVRCEGHQHVLTADYEWQAQQPLPKQTGQDVPSNVNLMGHTGFAAGPIEFVTAHQRLAERVVSTIAAVLGAALVPLLLWVLTNAYQRAQAARDLVLKTQQDTRDVAQKADALRFEAWKVIFPEIVANTKRHYLPISRRADRVIDLIDRIGSLPPTQSDIATLLERNVLLRAQVRRLGLAAGGFYFSSKSGEELCGELFDLYWPLCLGSLDEVAFATQATKTAKAATGDLDIPDNLDLSLAADKNNFDALERQLTTTLTASLATLNLMRNLLTTVRAILNFECDRPLYPKWYREAPIIDLDGFDLDGVPLGVRGPYISLMMAAYKGLIPPECLPAAHGLHDLTQGPQRTAAPANG